MDSKNTIYQDTQWAIACLILSTISAISSLFNTSLVFKILTITLAIGFFISASIFTYNIYISTYKTKNPYI